MPMSKNKQIGDSLVRALSVLCLALGAASVAAGDPAGEGPQQAAPQSPADTSLEEVVVTAETYKSTAQSTPISISALSGKMCIRDRSQYSELLAIVGLANQTNRLVTALDVAIDPAFL